MNTKTTRRQHLRTIGAAAAAVTALPLAGCSGGGGGSEPTETSGDGGEGTVTVEMTDELVFDPAEIEIAAGTTVVWKNVGTIGHSVTAYEDRIPDGAAYFASGGFDSEQAARSGYPQEGDIPGGESYEHTFETAGTYEYFCIPHESAGMTGTVTVT